MELHREIEYAWVAGFFDGEGTAYASRTRDRRYLVASIANSDRALLERAQRVCGGSIYERRSANRLQRKPLFMLHIQRRADVDRFVARVVPYLGSAKAAQVDEALRLERENPPRDRGAIWRTRRERYGPSGRKEGDLRLSGRFAAAE